jgi:hypothetical protein
MLNELFWLWRQHHGRFEGMSMFKISLSAVLLLAASPAAMAYENYIPLGTGYSTDVDSLPQFDSEAGEISRKTDVYETELYLENLKRAQEDSRLRNFFGRRDSTGIDNSIDY